MKKLQLSLEMPGPQVKSLEKQFLDDGHYDKPVVTEQTCVLKPNGDILFILLRGALQPQLCSEAWDVLRNVSGDAAHRETAAGGIMAGTGAVSDIIGAFDRMTRFPYCRLTSWTLRNPIRFAKAVPFIRAVDRVFRQHMPDRYEAQMAKVRETVPDWLIHGTAFTTVTVNKNWRTACHTDDGDLKEGFGVMTCFDRNFTGGELIFPKYRVAVKYGLGDVLLADVHEYHANGPIIPQGDYERMSCVFYYRTRMFECSTPAAEREFAKQRKLGDPVYGFNRIPIEELTAFFASIPAALDMVKHDRGQDSHRR